MSVLDVIRDLCYSIMVTTLWYYLSRVTITKFAIFWSLFLLALVWQCPWKLWNLWINASLWRIWMLQMCMQCLDYIWTTTNSLNLASFSLLWTSKKQSMGPLTTPRHAFKYCTKQLKMDRLRVTNPIITVKLLLSSFSVWLHWNVISARLKVITEL